MSSKVLVDKQELVNIANAIRAKSGITESLYVSELDDRIEAITGGDGVALPTLTNPASVAQVHEGYEYIDENGA